MNQFRHSLVANLLTAGLISCVGVDPYAMGKDGPFTKDTLAKPLRAKRTIG